MKNNEKTGFRIKSELNDIYHRQNISVSDSRMFTAINKSKNILSLTKSLNLKTILEIGAGDGSILYYLSKNNFAEKYYAVEITEDAVKIIKGRNILNLIKCSVFDGYNIKYKNNYFDLSILSHVIEHVEFPRKLLYEASRISKYIFIEVPLEDNIRLKKDFLLDDVGHINFFNFKTIKLLLESCDLKIENYLISYPSYNGNSYFRLFKNRLIRKFPHLNETISSCLFTYNASFICK